MIPTVEDKVNVVHTLYLKGIPIEESLKMILDADLRRWIAQDLEKEAEKLGASRYDLQNNIKLMKEAPSLLGFAFSLAADVETCAKCAEDVFDFERTKADAITVSTILYYLVDEENENK